MSIDTTIVTALAAVASGKVYPATGVPQGTVPPFVVYRRVARRELNTLMGVTGDVNSEYVFECWGKRTASANAKATSEALASDVRAAIEASAALTPKYPIDVSAEEYEPETLELMEPVSYGFWHT